MKVLLKKTARFARSLLAGTCTFFFISTGFAEEEVIEEQVVTGSRLTATTNETASQPISSISEEALTESGQFDIGEVLNDNPSLLNSVTATNSLDASAANIGQTQNFGGAILPVCQTFSDTHTVEVSSVIAGKVTNTNLVICHNTSPTQFTSERNALSTKCRSCYCLSMVSNY